MKVLKEIKSNKYNTEELLEILKHTISELDLKTIKQVQDITGKPSTSIRISNKYYKIELFNNKTFVVGKESDL